MQALHRWGLFQLAVLRQPHHLHCLVLILRALVLVQRPQVLRQQALHQQVLRQPRQNLSFLAARFHCLCLQFQRYHFQRLHSLAHRFHRSGRQLIVFHHYLTAHRTELLRCRCRYQLQVQREAHLQAHRRNLCLHLIQYLLLAQRVNHR